MLAIVASAIAILGMFGVAVASLILAGGVVADRPERAWLGAAVAFLACVGVFTFGAWLAGFPMQ